MTLPDRDKGGEPELASGPWVKPKALGDDILDLIIDLHVNEEVSDIVAETRVATIARQQRCKRMQSVSWQFAAIADRYMYTHVYLPNIDSLSLFYRALQDERNPEFRVQVRTYTRCVSFGFAFDPYQSANQGDPPIFEQVERILEICGRRLLGFRHLGAYLSHLPPALWKALVKHGSSVECLEGFSLELVTRNSDDFVQEIIGFPSLKRLTTTIVWMPPTFVPGVRERMLLTEDEKRQAGLLGRHYKKRFAQLESLRTPLLRWYNLHVEALMIAILPRLHSLQLDVWDSESVLRFLEKHGRKLVHVDMLQCRWSVWPDARNSRRLQPIQHVQERFQIEDIFTCCPSLKVFTLHQPESLAKLADRAGLLEGQSCLEILRLGSNDNSSYTSTLEYQPFDDVSFPFKNKTHLRATQQKLLATEWKRLFPRLRLIEVYLPEILFDPFLKACDPGRKGKAPEEEKVQTKEAIVSLGDIVKATLEWQRGLAEQGVALMVLPSAKAAQWQKASYRQL